MYMYPNLNSSLMMCERVYRLYVGQSEWRVPHIEHVVVPPAGEMSAVRAPGKATDLLTVAQQRPHVVVSNPHIVVVYRTRPRSTANI